MIGLIDLFFAPAKFWIGVFCPDIPAREPERFVIHLSASRKWRRRMKLIQRSR
ncbi:hypothetical protein QIH87_50100 (plasmid) [Bradyrhizobium elkanii]|uniref:hypothetical protein n=1 Tax=Bradyrhizobium elkanii TaxID=29448 RepID=UPI0021676BA9|nr:hypothetical protein [Bradyrhizobium elkanii]MCS3690912.1 hypothetical protein [Bradyrhizobium elkanii]WLB14785.1 hypothetical protein QIH87_50100 [Bradyrhizobium elkanii]WLB69123.1 hypothetical protein QIH89_27815 [Bradyrhizobium elkanii]